MFTFSNEELAYLYILFRLCTDFFHAESDEASDFFRLFLSVQNEYEALSDSWKLANSIQKDAWRRSMDMSHAGHDMWMLANKAHDLLRMQDLHLLVDANNAIREMK